MLDAFSLIVPTDPTFESLAPELATRYAELAGGSPVDAQAVGAALRAALARVSEGAVPGEHVDLAFRPEAGGVHVDLKCAGKTETINVTIPVAKG
jgi:hypothetical protein